MMLIFLELMDLLILLLIIAMSLGYHPTFYKIILAMVYMIGKAIIFYGSWLNWIDVAIAFYLVLMFFGFQSFLTVIIIIYLAYKLVAFIL